MNQRRFSYYHMLAIFTDLPFEFDFFHLPSPFWALLIPKLISSIFFMLNTHDYNAVV